MRVFTAFLLSILCLLLLRFSVVGFLACYELPTGSARLPWQLFYVGLITGAVLIGRRAVCLVRRVLGQPNIARGISAKRNGQIAARISG